MIRVVANDRQQIPETALDFLDPPRKLWQPRRKLREPLGVSLTLYTQYKKGRLSHAVWALKIVGVRRPAVTTLIDVTTGAVRRYNRVEPWDGPEGQ